MNYKKVLYSKPIIYTLIIILSTAFLVIGSFIINSKPAANSDYQFSDEYYRSKVEDILMEDEIESEVSEGTVSEKVIYFHALILEGKYKGQSILARQSFDQSTMMIGIPVTPGDKIFVTITEDEDGELIGFAADYVREIPILILLGGFILLLILFGGFKGLKTVISLAFTCLAVFILFIPAILKGFNPVTTSIIICIYIIIMTLSIVAGFNFKSYSAALGCIGGVAVAGIIVAIMESIMKISGLVDEDAMMILFATGDTTISLKGIIFASIIIGALGATMDVAISIASSLTEVLDKAPNLSFRQIVKSGLNIGRDIMGTMANTLILAYAGGSLHIVLLMTAYKPSFSQLINREMIAVEVLRAISGSIGILFTIPITAIITGFLYTRLKKKKQIELLNSANSEKGTEHEH